LEVPVMTKEKPLRSVAELDKEAAELDEEIADLERHTDEVRARHEVEAAKANELCDRVMEDVKKQLGEDSELYLTMLFAGMETPGRPH
jgi:hypothetical protein